MIIPDKVSGLFLIGLGAAAAYGGSLLPPVPGQQVGPNVFPMVVGGGLEEDACEVKDKHGMDPRPVPLR